MKLKFLLVFIICLQSLAAKNVIISGRTINDIDHIPVEAAVIKLLSSDSTFIRGTMSDAHGHFSIASDKNDCLLTVSMMGFETTTKHLSQLNDNLNLGDIMLTQTSVALSDVTVSQTSIVNEAYGQIITPTTEQIKTSTNGLDLLKRLQLPYLIISSADNNLSVIGGGAIQVRINGVLMTVNDLVAIRPEDVLRVEYHTDPAMRYAGASFVIDYITKRKVSGGNITLNTQNSVARAGHGEDNLTMRFNHKKSEFGFNTYLSYRDLNWVRENDELFHFPDFTLRRTEEGVPTQYKRRQLTSRLTYNLKETDKYFFSAVLSNIHHNNPNAYTDRNGLLYTDNDPRPIKIRDHYTLLSNAPSLDLYYERHFENDHSLIVNVLGTYINSKTTRLYQEQRDDILFKDIATSVHGEKYSLIAEGAYEKGFRDGELSLGFNHQQSVTHNIYTEDKVTNVDINMAETYLFAEYSLHYRKFNYTICLGVVRTFHSQEGVNHTKYIASPNFSMHYVVNPKMFVRFIGYLSGHAPTLSDLSDVQQDIDLVQVRRGNPNLSSIWYFNNRFMAGYDNGPFAIDLLLKHAHDMKAIMEEVRFEPKAEGFENGVFVRTKENQRGFHVLTAETNFRLKPYKRNINMSVAPGVRRMISLGNNYTHTYTNWYVRGTLDVNYKNWLLSAMVTTRIKALLGETLDLGELNQKITAGYNTGRWAIMGGLLNPFSRKYESGQINFSSLAPSESRIYTSDITPMPFVSFMYNFSFGQQNKSTKKRFNNTDNNAGILDGTKQ